MAKTKKVAEKNQESVVKTNPVEVANSSVEANLKEAKVALNSNSQTDYSKAKKGLETAVREYNKAVERVIFGKCVKAEKPFVEFIHTFSYVGKKVTETKDEESGIITDISVEDVPGKRLSLRGFVNRAGIGKNALSHIDDLRILLIIKCKEDFNPADYARESGTWFFTKTERQIDAGETPTSNRQLEKRVEEILADCGIESHIARPDRKYIEKCVFSHDNKHVCSVKPVSTSKLQTIMTEIMKHWVDGVPYSVFEQQNKQAAE